MTPERVVVLGAGAFMVVGAATGLGGIILKSETLKSIASTSLAIGVAVAFVPLIGFLLYWLYEKIRSS